MSKNMMYIYIIYIYSITYLYDINNIVSSMVGIDMTLVFSKLSHKKEIQLRKNNVPCSSYTGNQNLSEKASLHFFQATLLELSKHTAQIQFLSQPCGLFT